ncbi:transglutaminase TgpA family protein [Microbacterium protaetiae]|uniref:transglutaminase TgpA family protein n=1 Tax=Microbacterium protaetiae TaxID=2509458 RepID=UPI001F5D0D70|nr:DUF3488 and transglutaminase-like domain-containing protein [Microbacterium protaetiae]
MSLAIASWVALLAALVPLASVIAPGAWIAGVLVVSLAVLAAGFIARRATLPALVVSLIEAAVWVGLVTGIFLREAAIVFVVPTLHAFRLVPELIADAMQQIQTGVAPLPETTALAFCIVTAAGLIMIVVDHVVITARMPLAAAIALIAVSLIPSLAVPGPFDVIGFVVLAAAILFLLRAETGTRYQPPRAAPTAPGSTSAIAASIGLVAVLVAVAATPLLPTPPSRASWGPGGSTINASLDLGRDLRRPDPVTVLTLTTTGVGAPYLRAASLSSFNDDIWKPDFTATAPLGDGDGLGISDAGADIAVKKTTTKIHIEHLSARYLPVPYPATDVTGVGDGWLAMTSNRTIVSNGTTSTSGADYTVTTEVPEPTLEQIEASTAHSGDADTLGLQAVIPTIITEDARRVTAGTTTDYDALLALQNWFRGPDFQYSLSAPVQEGFDGSGVSAIASFLEAKSGYCVHFASAFAMMARVLGMSSRIVVGYLPGTPDTSGIVNGDSVVYTVSSTQLHAWPEVYFSGIGWVAFEPTKSLGAPTGFLPASAGGGDDVSPTDAPSATPTTAPSPSDRADPDGLRADDANTGDSAHAGVNLLPWALGAAGVVLLLLVPLLCGTLRRRRRDAAAHHGDTLAAWNSVRDAAIDLGIPVPVSESARVFGARLVRDHGAPEAETLRLVHAVEQAAYADAGGTRDGRAVVDAAAAVRTGLYLSVSGGARTRALLFPRSLLVRPGSVFARDGARDGASTPTR